MQKNPQNTSNLHIFPIKSRPLLRMSKKKCNFARKEKNIMNKPLLVVLTPVRNEAWILHAFLKATSLWADYIIIADQMSTDGSREIYPQYEKVILVDNPREEMHQARTRQLLFEAAKKIEGDKILFALDADEFLSGDFVNTQGWKTIINSEPGDVFSFRWMNLLPDITTYTSFDPYYWAVHINEETFNGEFPDNYIHEWRLPWPNKVNKEFIIEDISFIHLARVNVKRQNNKEIFYQVSTAYADKHYSGVRMFRHYQTYHPISEGTILHVPNEAYAFYYKHGIDIWLDIKRDDIGQHYIDDVLKKIKEKGLKYFSKLDIWNSSLVENNELSNPQTKLDKLVVLYLRLTKKYTNSLLVRGTDFILKKLY